MTLYFCNALHNKHSTQKILVHLQTNQHQSTTIYAHMLIVRSTSLITIYNLHHAQPSISSNSSRSNHKDQSEISSGDDHWIDRRCSSYKKFR